MKLEVIPTRRKLYCKRGMLDIMMSKGEYLLRDKINLFLVKDEKKEEIVFLKINYAELFNGRDYNNYPKDRLWVISFDLKEEQITLSVGNKIKGILKTLMKKGINFRLSRPLPPCIFKKNILIEKYRMPLNCEDCLELIILSKDGKDNLFCAYKSDFFLFHKKGRYEVLEFLRSFVGINRLERCNTCVAKLRCKFWLWKNSCYSYNGHEIKFNTLLYKEIKQRLMVPWLFFRYKWKIISDIPLYQRLLKYRLKNKWIIDAGGGYGRNSFGLYKISKKTVLVDIARDFFRYTSQRQKQKQVHFPIINADITQLPFKDNTVELVYSSGVLPVMPPKEKRRHLEECHRVLRRGGLFVGIVMAEWEVGKPLNLWPVTYKKDLICLLKSSGFDLIFLNKMRIEGDPLQHWYFLAGKSLSKKERNKSPFLYLSPSTITLFYKRKPIILYHLQRKRHHLLAYLSTRLWNLLNQQKLRDVVCYLKKKDIRERESIERELKNLIKEGFLEAKKGDLKCLLDKENRNKGTANAMRSHK